MTSYKSGMRSVWKIRKYYAAPVQETAVQQDMNNCAKEQSKGLNWKKKLDWMQLILHFFWAFSDDKQQLSIKMTEKTNFLDRSTLCSEEISSDKGRRGKQFIHQMIQWSVLNSAYPLFLPQREKSYSSRKKTHMVTTLLIEFISVAWE